jgi:hypothetical protein
MPCAAKVWKVHVVSSSFYSSLRSRFTSTRNNDNQTSIPSATVGQPKIRRRGLYSIGTFPSTNHSTSQLATFNDLVELKSIKGTNLGHLSKASSVLEQEEHKVQDGSQIAETSTHESLTFNDLSNFLREPNDPV